MRSLVLFLTTLLWSVVLMAVDRKCPVEACVDGSYERHHFVEKNCRCDKLCKFYNDCCHKTKKETLLLKNASCINDERLVLPESYNHLYMIDACPPHFTNHSNSEMDIYRSKCEAESMPSDDKSWGTRYFLPVSGRITVKKKRPITVVFRNIYCAVCNSATWLKSWNVVHDCMLTSRISNGTRFSRDLYNSLLTASISKSRCKLRFQPPDDDLDKSGVRYCKRAHSNAGCSSSENSKNNKLCVTAPSRNVYVDNEGYFTAFRNEYCARCHNLNLTYVICRDPRGIPDYTKKSGKFNYRFRVNWLQSMGSIEYFEDFNSNGKPTVEKFGKLTKCTKNTVYDPFDRSCHSVCPENRYTTIEGDWEKVKCSETPQIEISTRSTKKSFSSTSKSTTIRPTSSTSTDKWTTLEMMKKTPKPARREVPVEKESLCPPDKRLVLVKNDSKGDSIVMGYRVMLEEGTGRYYICSKQKIGKGHSVTPVHAYTFDFDRNLYVEPRGPRYAMFV
ncbi:DgyrCDS5918 [Dimorphilus gyrociliatus]|uniref:DgyrCDS5918 n=1 Tax=Dimorphilus gyrociliatus TaxID=2664684 RepID=A0A7I8VLH0_9ANNE|nr:DgyrCDS5918 [Dimorphilus gyrociliatus]